MIDPAAVTENAHGQRKHAKYSASSMDRLEACPGSAALSEGLPDKSSPWAEEGTTGHEVLEAIVHEYLTSTRPPPKVGHLFFNKPAVKREMILYATDAANFITELYRKTPGAEISIETKVDLNFIHPDAGGTLDYSVAVLFDTLHILDYKYGAGHAVSPVDNLQLATYGVGEAEKYHWNFKRIRQWIIQPRVRGYDGPMFWELPTMEYKNRFVPRLRRIVERAETETDVFAEGSHCHWCKAKKVCPLKVQGRNAKAIEIFKSTPLYKREESIIDQYTEEGDTRGQEEQFKSEAEWRKEARGREGSKAKGRARETKGEASHADAEKAGASQGCSDFY